MVHSGYEASAVNETFGSLRGFVDTVKATLFNRYEDPGATRLLDEMSSEAAGPLREPQRIVPLFSKLASDKLRTTFEHRHLYSYAAATVPTADALRSVVDWIFHAQRPDGGIAAYYSFLTGYSESYPEVTGYIIPTLYDFGRLTGDLVARHAIYLATDWLLSLQMTSGAFPGGLHASDSGPHNNGQPSVFNTGQILQGLVRAHTEMQAKTRNVKILKSAVAAGDWLAAIQQADGSWTRCISGNCAHLLQYGLVGSGTIGCCIRESPSRGCGRQKHRLGARTRPAERLD